MFIAKAVLPIDGLPATIIKSPFCKPVVFSSNLLKPVGTPVIPPFVSCSFSIVFIDSPHNSLRALKPFSDFKDSSVIPNIFCSASSKSVLLSTDPSCDFSIKSLLTLINCLIIDCSLTILAYEAMLAAEGVSLIISFKYS